MHTSTTRTLAAVLGLCLASAAMAQSYNFWAVNTSNELAFYSSSNVSTPISSVGISGLKMSDGTTDDSFGQVYNITYAGSSLYALDGNANLYTLNTGTGAATFVNNLFAPSGFDGGLSYDPFTLQLRWVSDSAENTSLSLGGTVSAGNDVYYGSGDANFGTTPSFTALSIDPDFGTGWVIDPELDIFGETFDPNFEEFFTVGSLGFDITGLSALDFLNESTLIAALSEDAVASSLYTIDPATGTATLVGAFGTGITAIAVSAIPEPGSAAALVGFCALGLVASRRRRA